MLFGGFSRCLYPIQKFDSDSERLLACVLERHADKWVKPAKGTFHIHYEEDRAYEPDFIVETATDKLILEPKRRDDLQDPIVVAKARAASTWCRHATAYELEHGDRKPWRYLLIPHDVIGDNATLQGLIEHHEHRATAEDG
jgi:type III restriction enzyme